MQAGGEGGVAGGVWVLGVGGVGVVGLEVLFFSRVRLVGVCVCRGRAAGCGGGGGGVGGVGGEVPLGDLGVEVYVEPGGGLVVWRLLFREVRGMGRGMEMETLKGMGVTIHGIVRSIGLSNPQGLVVEAVLREGRNRPCLWTWLWFYLGERLVDLAGSYVYGEEWNDVWRISFWCGLDKGG